MGDKPSCYHRVNDLIQPAEVATPILSDEGNNRGSFCVRMYSVMRTLKILAFMSLMDECKLQKHQARLHFRKRNLAKCKVVQQSRAQICGQKRDLLGSDAKLDNNVVVAVLVFVVFVAVDAVEIFQCRSGELNQPNFREQIQGVTEISL